MSVCGRQNDHCVQVVGVSTSKGIWKVRNSWGTRFGEGGYIYLKYGQNTCNLASEPTYTSTKEAPASTFLIRYQGNHNMCIDLPGGEVYAICVPHPPSRAASRQRFIDAK